MERHASRIPRRKARPRAVRAAGRTHAGCSGGDLWGRAAYISGTRPEGRSTGAVLDGEGSRCGAGGGNLSGSKLRDAGGIARDPEVWGRLPAARAAIAATKAGRVVGRLLSQSAADRAEAEREVQALARRESRAGHDVGGDSGRSWREEAKRGQRRESGVCDLHVRFER